MGLARVVLEKGSVRRVVARAGMRGQGCQRNSRLGSRRYNGAGGCKRTGHPEVLERIESD